MPETNLIELAEQDRQHLIHPLHHPQDHAEALIFARGDGAVLWDVSGKEYLDAMSGLWNVNIGLGRKELAEAAAAQLSTLAYCSGYAGSTNVPAIELATRLSQIAYPSLNTVFFTNSGVEANESAFKTVRFYWRVMEFRLTGKCSSLASPALCTFRLRIPTGSKGRNRARASGPQRQELSKRRS